MALLGILQEAVKDAMRSGDGLTRDTLRMVIAALKHRELELGRDLDPAEETTVLGKAVKTREESVEQFAAAGRADLADRERQEIAVLQRYLPKQLSEAEAREIVRATIGALGAKSKADLGKVMKTVMAEQRGKIDGKLVQRLVQELLGS